MKKDRKLSWWILILILAIVAAFVGGYYLMKERGPKEIDVPVTEEKEPLRIKDEPKEVPAIKKEILPKEEVIPITESEEEPKPLIPEDPCEIIEDQLQDFFNYLNTKSYIHRIKDDLNTYDQFKLLIKKLSSNPPIPAGEGLDKEIMIKNIFYFFRILSRNDIRLIKEIIRNEADSIEMNMEIFYKWIMQGNICPDKEGIRPSLDVIYHYAGYFLNTLGGRAYLLRRPTGVRLVISYYCVLILHEADKKGGNRYGIDIFPEIDPLLKDISLYPDLRFQGDYINQLTKIQDYYLEKR